MAEQNLFIFLGSPAHRTSLTKWNEVVWTAHKSIKQHELAVFYITAPVSAIVATGIMRLGPWRNTDPRSPWKGRWMAEMVINNANLFIPIGELREIFPEWRWLKYPRANTPVPADIAAPLFELINKEAKEQSNGY